MQSLMLCIREITCPDIEMHRNALPMFHELAFLTGVFSTVRSLNKPKYCSWNTYCFQALWKIVQLKKLCTKEKPELFYTEGLVCMPLATFALKTYFEYWKRRCKTMKAQFSKEQGRCFCRDVNEFCWNQWNGLNRYQVGVFSTWQRRWFGVLCYSR